MLEIIPKKNLKTIDENPILNLNKKSKPSKEAFPLEGDKFNEN